MGQFEKGGFNPIYDGFIRFNTASFAPSASISAQIVQDNLVNNLEWLYGTHTQIRINWNNQDGISVGGTTAPLTPGSQSLLYSDGPFPLSIADDGTPFPLYVRVEAGVFGLPFPNVTAGTIHVHLRQNNEVNSKFYEAEVGTIGVVGSDGDRAVYELTTVSSSLSTSSSLLEIGACDIQPLMRLPVRTTRSLTTTDEQVDMLFCWLDFYGRTPPSGETIYDPADGFAIYGVYAAEFCPKKSE